MRLFLRAAWLALVIGAFLVLGSPFQWLARRRRWPLRFAMQRWFAHATCAAIGLRVRVVGAPAPRRPLLVLANHLSWTDVMAICTAMPACFVARHDVAHWPILGLLARLQDTVFVERGRRRAIGVVNAAMAARLDAGEPVVLFAEGTSGDGTWSYPFRSSHVAAAGTLLAARPDLVDVIVQPLALAFTRRGGLPLDRAERAAAAWYGDMPLLPHLASLCADGPLECTLAFGEPLAFTRDSRSKAVAASAEVSVARLSEAMRRHDELARPRSHRRENGLG